MRKFTPRNYGRLLQYIMGRGREVEIDGQKTVEIVDMHLLLRNPKDRLVICSERRINLPFGIAEWIGLVTGESRVEFFKNFIADYDRFSTDGMTVDGAYGNRLQSGERENQIVGLLAELRRSELTRRAVATIYNGTLDLFGGGGVNTPCTLSLQFLVREGRLNMITTMRSNDAIWGFNYDLIMFTMLQEFIARHLGVELGDYSHNAGSFHIYERHWGLANSMKCSPRWPFTMDDMPQISFSEMEVLRMAYLHIKDRDVFDSAVGGLSQYTRDLAYAARAFVVRKSDPEEASFAHRMIENYTIRRVMRPWVQKETAQE